MVGTAEDHRHLCAALQDALAPFVAALGDLAARVGALEARLASPDTRLIEALREIEGHGADGKCGNKEWYYCAKDMMATAATALAAHYQGQTGGSDRA